MVVGDVSGIVAMNSFIVADDAALVIGRVAILEAVGEGEVEDFVLNGVLYGRFDEGRDRWAAGGRVGSR